MRPTRKAIAGLLGAAILGTGIGYAAAPEAIPARPSPCERTSLALGTYVLLPDGSRGHVVDSSPSGKAIGYIAIHDDGGWIDFIRECDVTVLDNGNEADDDEPV